MALRADTLSLKRHPRTVLAWTVCLVTGCAAPSAPDAKRDVPAGAASLSAPAPSLAGSVPVPVPVPMPMPMPAPAPAPASASVPPVLSCPSGMSLLPGGSFWVGADPNEHYAEDESPRFRTTLAPFCVDQTEVTVAAYADCVAHGACTPAVASHSQCNAAHRARPDYPINCVTWPQADAFCSARGQRLLSEAEWEYAARGGTQYLKYPWGSASPDGHACWKHGGGSCSTKQYPAGAFGLFDRQLTMRQPRLHDATQVIHGI